MPAFTTYYSGLSKGGISGPALDDRYLQLGFGFKVGQGANGGWITPTAGDSSTTGTTVENTTVVTPIVVLGESSFDRIALRIRAAGGSGSVVRLGIWQPRTGSTTCDLILDAGTIDGTATGAAAITISQTLQPGLYLLSATPQGNASTPTWYRASMVFPQMTSSFLGTVAQVYLAETMSGALPSTATLESSSGVDRAPCEIGLRFTA